MLRNLFGSTRYQAYEYGMYIYIYIIYTRRSACVPAVAGTHAPGRRERVVGSRRWPSVQLVVVVGVRVKDNAKWWKC